MLTHTDEYGFYHHVTNPNHMSSENPSLFSGGMGAMASLVNHPILMSDFKAMEDGNNYTTHITDLHANFSHDEMTGQYCGRFVQRWDVKDLPIIKWKSQGVNDDYQRNYWLHPRDIICYLIFRNNVLGFLLSPLYILFAAVSFLAERNHTSGKCKHFYVASAWSAKGNRIQSFLGRRILSLGEKLCKKEHGEQPFIDIFSIYFKDKLHISHELIGEYYASIRFSTKDKNRERGGFAGTFYSRFK